VVWAKDKHGEIGKRPSDEGVYWHDDWDGMLRRLDEYNAAFLGRKAKAREVGR
jgi:hypothetical protein